MTMCACAGERGRRQEEQTGHTAVTVVIAGGAKLSLGKLNQFFPTRPLALLLGPAHTPPHLRIWASIFHGQNAYCEVQLIKWQV